MHKEKGVIGLKVDSLHEGTNEREFTCDAADFNDHKLIDAGFRGKVQIEVAAEKSETEITVSIRTSAEAELSCDICLAPLSKTLIGDYRIFYVYKDHAGSEFEDDDEYRLLERSAETIDITEDVRETLLLSIPMKVTCTDNPECRTFPGEKKEQTRDDGDRSTWQKSLEKLKNKYR
ncbi:MAG: DUF177 domain-containing protein [Chlorobiaceae bacterium]|nr:DUF177 domain-containing protein [Chlorobiaceae bacterium]NTV61574.1 DUF177 domain-containing protein [Chlorobiaceae bacterium]